jgi:hypothetical protein
MCSKCGEPVDDVDTSDDFEANTTTWRVRCHGEEETRTFALGEGVEIPAMAFLKPA